MEQIRRRDVIGGITAALTSDPGPHIESGCWLDAWRGRDILAAIERAGFTREFQREIQRLKRQHAATARREKRVENVVLWRGVITDPLPEATFRPVARGTRSRTAKADIRIADLGAAATWQGIALPRGSRLLLDSRAGEVVGSQGEIIETPKGVRAHIWRSKAMQGRSQSPILPPMAAEEYPAIDDIRNIRSS